MFVSTEQESCDLHFGVTSLTKKTQKLQNVWEYQTFGRCPLEPWTVQSNLFLHWKIFLFPRQTDCPVVWRAKGTPIPLIPLPFPEECFTPNHQGSYRGLEGILAEPNRRLQLQNGLF